MKIYLIDWINWGGNLNKKYDTVAEAVRVEYDQYNDELYLVFIIVDEGFKKQIKNDWLQDIQLVLIDKKLVK